jgi:hypothetical protein
MALILRRRFFRLLLLAFVFTSAIDFAINALPPPFGAVLLKPYFRSMTGLKAALLAGVASAIALVVLEFVQAACAGRICDFDYGLPCAKSLAAVFWVSLLVGYPMDSSGLFPELSEHYYRLLPRHQTAAADGLSGVIVATCVWLVVNKWAVMASALPVLVPFYAGSLVVYVGMVHLPSTKYKWVTGF